MNSITLDKITLDKIILDNITSILIFQTVIIILLIIFLVYLLIKMQKKDKKEHFYADSVSTEAIDNLAKISGNIMKDDNLIIPATTTTMTNLTVNKATNLATANIDDLYVTNNLFSNGDMSANGITAGGITISDQANMNNVTMNGFTKILKGVQLNGSPLVPHGTIRLVDTNLIVP